MAKRHRIEPRLWNQLEYTIKEVDEFINRSSDKFFIYNRWTGRYRVDLAPLMEEVARLTALLEAIKKAAGPSYTLTNGIIL